MSDLIRVSPDIWYEEVHGLVLTPFTKPDHIDVLDKQTIERFEILDNRAKAHAIARAEHDAMLYLTIYAMWNASLWRVAHNSFEDYCKSWEETPLGVSTSSIKHKIADIKKLLALGVTPQTIVKALGKIPMATRKLAEEFTTTDENANLVPDQTVIQKLPDSLSPDRYLEELVELGAIQANIAVDEFLERPMLTIADTAYDADEGRVLFTVVYDSEATGKLITHLSIENVPDYIGPFIAGKLKR